MTDHPVVSGLPFPEEKKKFIVDKLDPVLEEMVADVITDLPSNPTLYMIEWLRKKSPALPKGKLPLKEEVVALKAEIARHKNTSGAMMTSANASAAAKEAESEEEEEDDDAEDELPPEFLKPKSQMTGARASVSAEAYGAWNKKQAFEPPSYPKTPEQRERLQGVLGKSFLFAALEPKDMEVILMAMKEAAFEAGAKIITEGEDGDYLFVIEVGSPVCKKLIEGEQKVVKECAPGDVFGELALLYNCPRAASVEATDSCVCWQLDRETFNNIVRDAAVRQREKYNTFLAKVSILSSMDPYERSQIADALKPEMVKDGDTVVTQGEPGDKFYIVEDGTLCAMKSVDNGVPSKVMDYKAGDYFGELALLKNQPRAASVKATSDAKLLWLDRRSFTKMLGPLQDMLSRDATRYN